MPTDFAFDLRLARRKAGLTQRDCAHLLAVKQSRLSALEKGVMQPSLEELCILSVVYSRSFEQQLSAILADAQEKLRRRLPSLPAKARKCAATFNRKKTLERVERRVREISHDHGRA